MMAMSIELQLIILSLTLTIGSAIAQVVAKLWAHKVLNELRSQLEEARRRHRNLLTEYYLRQHFLCRELSLPLPARPASTIPPQPGDADEASRPLWRRLLRRKPKTTLTQGSTGSARLIVGRHASSVAFSIIWKLTSASILRLVRPLGMRAVQSLAPRILQPLAARSVHIAPRLFALGGGAGSAGGSLAASTAARAAVSTISIVGIIIGPALAAWTVISELRKIKKARRNLKVMLEEQNLELAAFQSRNRELEGEYARAAKSCTGARELVISGV